MSLFRKGEFKLHSGAKSSWKIDCDALTSEDWETLALIAVERLPSFGWVIGVPQGGLSFAAALQKYTTQGPFLICDDVLTTGASMEEYRRDKDTLGVVVFARGPVPKWVLPLFTLAVPPVVKGVNP